MSLHEVNNISNSVHEVNNTRVGRELVLVYSRNDSVRHFLAVQFPIFAIPACIHEKSSTKILPSHISCEPN